MKESFYDSYFKTSICISTISSNEEEEEKEEEEEVEEEGSEGSAINRRWRAALET